jgi:uncharacterized metal-binding protein
MQQWIGLLTNIIQYHWISILLFSIGMMISSPIPDSDLTDKEKGVKIWNFFVHNFIYKPLAFFLKLIGKENWTGHRNIFHTIWAIIYYLIAITIYLMILAALIYFILNISLVNNDGYETLMINSLHFGFFEISSYSIYLIPFLVGCAAGFLSHLIEDSMTLEGISFIHPRGTPGKRIGGKFRTVPKQGVAIQGTHPTQYQKFSFWKRSGFACDILMAFNILYISTLLYSGFYTHGFVINFIIYAIALELFMIIFADQRIK